MRHYPDKKEYSFTEIRERGMNSYTGNRQHFSMGKWDAPKTLEKNQMMFKSVAQRLPSSIC